MGHLRSFLEFLREVWKEVLDGATRVSYEGRLGRGHPRWGVLGQGKKHETREWARRPHILNSWGLCVFVFTAHSGMKQGWVRPYPYLASLGSTHL